MKPSVTIGGTWYFPSCIAPLCPTCMPAYNAMHVIVSMHVQCYALYNACTMLCMWSSVCDPLWSLKMCPVSPHQPESVLRRTLVPVSGEKPSTNPHFRIHVIMQSAWCMLYLGGHSVRLCKQSESCLCPCDQSVNVCSVIVYAIIQWLNQSE